MNKIEQINISDFRIYQGKQEFKFQNKRGTANLVALYAPNGFGKTSFFDAVEWGYSDKIQRLEQKVTNDSIKNEEDFGKEDKVILTNRASYDEGKKGIVEIITTDKSFQKEVVFRKVQNVETRYDYRPGKFLHSDFQKSELKELPETNVLSQDQIDSFLRYKTPEQKFENLKEFWVEGEVTLNKYKKVDDTFRQIVNKLCKYHESRERLNNELEGIVFDPKKINDINDALDKLEADQLFKNKYTRLEEPLERELFKKLSKELNISSQESSKVSHEKKVLRDEIKLIIEKFDTYQKNKISLNKINEELVEIKLKKKNFHSLSSAKAKRDDLENQSTLNNEVIKDYRNIHENIESFCKIQEDIEKFNEEIIKCNKNLEKTDFKEFLVSKWQRGLARSKSKLLEEYDLIVADLDVAKLQSEKYFFDIKENKKNKIRLPKLQDAIKRIQNKITSNNKLITKYQTISTEKKWDKSVLEIEGWDEKVVEFQILNKQLTQAEKDLKTKKEKLQKSGSLEENLERIKHWGKEYVQETKQQNCPLCNKGYEDFERLLAQIETNKNKILDIEGQKSAIEMAERKVVEIGTNMDEVRKFFVDNLNNEISKLKAEIKESVKLKEGEEFEFNAITRKIQFFTSEYKRFTELLSKYLEKNEELSDELIPEILQRIEVKKRSLIGKRERLEKILNNINDFSISNEIEKVQCLKSISAYNKDIKDIEETDLYKKVEELVAKHRIKKEELENKDYIGDLVKAKSEKNEKVLWNLKVKTRYIKLLDRAVDSSKCEISEKLIGREIEKKESGKNELLREIKIYEDKYEILVNSKNYNQVELNQKLRSCDELIKAYGNHEENLFSVKADLELLEGGLRQRDIADQLNKLTKEEKKLETLKEQVTRLKESCMSYIQKGISNYFNKDVINQIYQRIEPHPELKEIEFKAEVGKKSPRLIITAKGSDEVNPNLYLSAGQVNVLSLSIFLAKAFEFGKDTISTIFMDDPIQNLSDINILSFIDILRTLTNEHDKQIVISTHDEKFFRLLQNKLPEEYCNSKYIEFESEGKIKLN